MSCRKEMIQRQGRDYEAVGQSLNGESESRTRRGFCVSGSMLRFFGAGVGILLSVITTVTMSETLQKVNKEFHKPFFSTYMIHGYGYATLYVFWQAWLLLPRNMVCTRGGEGAWQGRSRQLIIPSLFLSIIYSSTVYSWYYSLPRTNIPANIAIFQAACVWVFIFSIFLLREKVTLLKILAVLISVLGVSLVAVYSNSCHSSSSNSHSSINDTSLTNSSSSSSSSSPSSSSSSSFLSAESSHINRGSCTEKSTFAGYVALLYSVISISLFQVGYKRWGSEEGDPASIANSLRFLGYMGIQTLVWLWPVFIILHYSGIEPFEWPPYDIFIQLLLSAVLDMLANVGLLIAIALSSALFASVGTILVIPTAVVVDWILQGFLLSLAAALGVVFIVCGFIGFVISEIIAIKTIPKDSGRDGSNGRLLQSSVCPHKDNGLWEEEEEGEEGERGEEETRSLLRSRRRKRMRTLIIKYLF